MNKINEDTMEAHKMALEALYNLDPETQAHQLRISYFFLKHPELVGISYTSADFIIAEKDVHVTNAAIRTIANEIKRRGDVDAPEYRLAHQKVTENQVRRILHIERLKANPNTKSVKPQNAEITLKCSICKKKVPFKRITRDNVISFRATEPTEDAITHLANVCNISRSRLISELLLIERRFGM